MHGRVIGAVSIGTTFLTYGKLVASWIALQVIILIEAFFGILAALFLKRVTGEHFDSGPWLETKEEKIDVRTTGIPQVTIEPEQMARFVAKNRVIT